MKKRLTSRKGSVYSGIPFKMSAFPCLIMNTFETSAFVPIILHFLLLSLDASQQIEFI